MSIGGIVLGLRRDGIHRLSPRSLSIGLAAKAL
jgi:hypothetical protein